MIPHYISQIINELTWIRTIFGDLTGLCDAGYYCPPGQTEANPSAFECPAGYYCPEGSATFTACPIGTFSNSTGNTNVTDCKPCTPGMTIMKWNTWSSRSCKKRKKKCLHFSKSKVNYVQK